MTAEAEAEAAEEEAEALAEEEDRTSMLEADEMVDDAASELESTI